MRIKNGGTYRFILCWLTASVLLTSAVNVQGQENKAAEHELDPNQLVVGDWYDVTIERNGVKAQASGMLLKVTDDWIALGVVRAAANDVGVPILSKVPGRQRLFRRVEVISKAYDWIPRDAAHIDKRQEVTHEEVKKEFQNDVPELKGQCFVHFSADKVEKEVDGDFAGVEASKVSIENNVGTAVKDDSKLSQLPIIGSFFAKRMFAFHVEKKSVALEDVLFIETQRELTLGELALVRAGDAKN
jgi:hypothetical protein